MTQESSVLKIMPQEKGRILSHAPDIQRYGGTRYIRIPPKRHPFFTLLIVILLHTHVACMQQINDYGPISHSRRHEGIGYRIGGRGTADPPRER